MAFLPNTLSMSRMNQRGAASTGMIRTAERHIQGGDYQLALRWLQEARTADPANGYIPAIIERVNDLIAAATRRKDLETAAQAPAPQGLEGQVRRLTVVATQLFERGSYESALDSLMKARNLDPSSPYVSECESLLLPALEVLKKRGTPATVVVKRDAGSESQAPPHVSEYLARHPELDGDELSLAGSEAPPASPNFSAPRESRIEFLKRLHEEERRRREQAMWREASRPPRLLGTRIEPLRDGENGVDTARMNTKDGSFFAKIRQGRLLG